MSETVQREGISQIFYTTTSNRAPPANSLLVGELACEVNDPMRLWIGVPVALSGDGQKLIYDAGASLDEAPADGQIYGRRGSIAQWQPVLPLTGGTLTGPLVVPVTPTLAGHATSKAYVDSQIAASMVQVGDIPPPNPRQGNLWWDSLGTQLYMWYADPTSSAWVVAVNQSGFLSDGPHDGTAYGRQDGTWQRVLPLSGGTLSGPLWLAADATSAMQAVTLQQMTTAIGGGFPEAPADGAIYGRQGSSKSWLGVLPLTGGTLTGRLNMQSDITMTYGLTPPAAGAHTPAAYLPTVVLPSGQNVMWNGYINLAGTDFISLAGGPCATIGFGGSSIYFSSYTAAAAQDSPTTVTARMILGGGSLTMDTGTSLILAHDPTQPMEAVTLQYLQARPSGASIIISDTPPASPTSGNMWFDSVGAQTYIWYPDPNSAAWVPMNAPPPATTVAFLPLSGGTLTGPLVLSGDPTTALQASTKQYTDAGDTAAKAYADTGDATVTTRAARNTGRNILHNSLFNVNQRGTGPFNASGYTSDRWKVEFVTTSGSCGTTINPVAANVAASSFGDEACENILVVNAQNPGPTGANDYMMVRQFLEDARRLAGKTVIASFWAWATSGTPKVCVEMYQSFGTGGSPSAGVQGIGMTPITISTTPTRYSVPINLPSVAGKTFGTNVGTDFTEFNIWLACGATMNAGRAGGIGFQTNTFLFWGVQLEIVQPGVTQPTSLEKVDPQQDLAKCQRFYSTGSRFQNAAGNGGQISSTTVCWPVRMRANPTVVATPISLQNCGALQVSGPSVDCMEFYVGITTTGNFTAHGSWTAAAELA